MKKIFMLSVAVILVLSLGAVAFADTVNTKEVPAWFNEMIKWKKEQVQKAVNDKQITQEEAKLFNERLETMEKYHQENGFNFPGGCGFGRGGRGFNGGMMRGFGGGMMRGFSSTPQTNSF